MESPSDRKEKKGGLFKKYTKRKAGPTISSTHNTINQKKHENEKEKAKVLTNEE